jgi:asparagine synthase (glutamine-hydrolysing)
MCGLSGFVDFKRNSTQGILEAMQQTLLHRGPDDKGKIFIAQDTFQIGLAHTRLSILDTSPLGHQPMTFRQFTIVLNGEIYNFKEIREELFKLGHSFTSNSDTEVVLNAYAAWGKNCVNKFIGMFAFVIYDAELQQLSICRDRVGVKPLFYYWHDGLFLFASELKAFHSHPGFRKEINQEALALYLQHGYVPGPKCIFDHAFKLEPAYWLVFDFKKKLIKKDCYWSIDAVFQQPLLNISYSDAKQQLESLLQSACNYRMVADVPVGIFLSGGFDSTLVTALLQKESNQRLKTFTIGFPDGIDEAPYAKQIAEHLGTDHTSYNCTETDAKAIIPELAYYYDEPCADISAIPTILVSRMAHQQVTVALSADGGDELFAGYDGFKQHIELIKRVRKVPFPYISGEILERLTAVIPAKNVSLRKKAYGLSKVLQSPQEGQYDALIKWLTGIPKEYSQSFLKVKQSDNSLNSMTAVISKLSDERNSLLVNGFGSTLSDMLLVKVDRATMSAGLEGREPLLDHRLIEFAGQLPYEFKHDGILSKKIVRDIVYQYVPQSIMDRKKIGFDLPLFKWLRNDLAYLIDEVLNEAVVRQEDLLDWKQISIMIRQFRENDLKYDAILWRLINFRMWSQRWMKE